MSTSVKVDAGRNLTLTSEEDSDRYDSKQQSASAGGSFTFGSMTGGGERERYRGCLVGTLRRR
ncbi:MULTISPECIES: hypothetical protein [Pantoea]|uniref:hypothetical protein n=1 Tax=Pantoea TaxID=53335 RepID=UPI0009402D2E|nr:MULTISPECIES: hypothetical protein [Pantoea]KAF6631049.1 hypothetical protein HFD95_16240 [Pantoea sp. EKM10T]KAF6680577.1 hypothetical protein HFD94_15050 [Pantoea sp. EKM20T]MBD8262792.1 hypothetical protein [Pantoea agglomerans]MDQ0434725.1 hypothetical protein [Pantoea agglomerans]MRT09556.1 hypothetical protein [Pantoea agglomerans]